MTFDYVGWQVGISYQAGSLIGWSRFGAWYISVRDKPTQNYRIPLKTPEMIRDYARWLTDYPGDCIAGPMFFNEVRTSEQKIRRLCMMSSEIGEQPVT
jgi:hypothetical protein